MRLRIAVPMILLSLLCACGTGNPSARTPESFREELVRQGLCSYTMTLRADYGDRVRDYTLDCVCPLEGPTELTVLAPEIARDITATVGGGDATVSFQDTVLAVEDFGSRPASPLSAPYLLLRAWSGGSLRSAFRDGDLDAAEYLLDCGGRELTVTTWFREGLPLRAEISDGSRVLLTGEIENLAIQKKADDHEQEPAETNLGGDQP